MCVLTDMGAGLYGALKFTTSDVITTVTPEKRAEETRAELGRANEAGQRGGDTC